MKDNTDDSLVDCTSTETHAKLRLREWSVFYNLAVLKTNESHVTGVMRIIPKILESFFLFQSQNVCFYFQKSVWTGHIFWFA